MDVYEEITVQDIKIDLIKKRIKNLHLSVHPPDGRVRLAVPARVSEEAIRKFVSSKIPWIEKHRHRIKEQEKYFAKEYVSGEIHYFLGKEYLLEVNETFSPTKMPAENGSKIILTVKPRTSVQKKQKILNDFYRKELKKLIPSIIGKWEEIIGVSVNDFGIKQMKTRWGTCNSKAKRIWFNLELAKKPVRCIEYIAVHEMVHFLERRHNYRFKAYMSKYLPEWKSYRKELNSFPSSGVKMDY